MKHLKNSIKQIITTAMDEDCVYNDITTTILVDKTQSSEAYIISREDAVLCGTDIIYEIFRKFDPKVKVFSYHKDGAVIKKNEPVIFLKGSTRSILSCERIALNFLGPLSGISTLTAQFVKKVSGSNVKILDTRKTTPGLRDLEKYAVLCGEGENHRRDLSDMILVKDNHLLAKTKHLSFKTIVSRIRRKTKKPIELEVDTIEQFKEALNASADIILLDNMTIKELKQAVALKKKTHHRVLLEASGNVNLQTISQIAKTGVNRISIGQLTHSARSINFSMEFVK